MCVNALNVFMLGICCLIVNRDKEIMHVSFALETAQKGEKILGSFTFRIVFFKTYERHSYIMFQVLH